MEGFGRIVRIRLATMNFASYTGNASEIDMKDGYIACLALLVFLIGFATGCIISTDQIKTDCEKLGQFRAMTDVFVCFKVERK